MCVTQRRNSKLVLGCLVSLSLLACSSPRADLERENESPQPGDGAKRADQLPIVFCSDRDDPGVGDLYLMSTDGAVVERLTDGGNFWMPRWSPDGRRVAFRQDVAGLVAEVGVLSPDDQGLVLLTEGEPAHNFGSSVNFAADGEAVAFVGYGEPEAADTRWLFTVSIAGGQRKRLFPDHDLLQYEAAWSPDGRQLAHTEATTEGVDRDLFVGDAATTGARTNLTEGRVYAPNYLAWSPDGSRIAFSGYPLDADGNLEGLSQHGHGASVFDEELFVIEVASRALTRLTDNDAEDSSPAWSPDGQSLLFTSNRDGDPDLWLGDLAAFDEARNLIDDAAAPHEESFARWYWAVE